MILADIKEKRNDLGIPKTRTFKVQSPYGTVLRPDPKKEKDSNKKSELTTEISSMSDMENQVQKNKAETNSEQISLSPRVQGFEYFLSFSLPSLQPLKARKKKKKKIRTRFSANNAPKPIKFCRPHKNEKKNKIK